MNIVSDAGPILSFARAGRIDLLRLVVGELIIPNAVLEDITVRGKGKPGSVEVVQGSWIKCESVQDRSFLEKLPAKLGLGEREALALAKELDASLLVDEREARKEALQLGIRHFGSLRLLKEAKDRGIISKVKPVLDALITSGTYLSEDLYQAFLRELGEGKTPLPR